MKEEASDYLELDTVKNLVKKYSQFINFPIYVWSSKVSAFNRALYAELYFIAHGLSRARYLKKEGIV